MSSSILSVFTHLLPDAVLASPTLLLLFTLLLASPLAYIIYLRTFHPLASIPGPFAASISKLWLIKQYWGFDLHESLMDVHKRYGPFVRTAPDQISVADLATIKAIYAPGNGYRKSDWYVPFKGRRRFDLTAETDEKVHGAQRRLVSRAYSIDALRDLEPKVDDVIAAFMKHMEDRLGTVIDIGDWAQLFAYDAIGSLSFSRLFGFMDAGRDDGTFEQIDAAKINAGWLGQVPWLYHLHDFLSPVIGNWFAVTNRSGPFRAMAEREIAAHKARGGVQHDLLGKLIAIAKEKPALDEDGIGGMLNSNIFAGSDTTALGIRSFIYYLLKHPEYHRKFLQEVNDFRAQGNLSDPPTYNEASKMPYLQAAMHEALRMFPPWGAILSRVVPAGGLNAAGHHFPEGTVIGASPWVVHRIKSVFGDDADVFRPERWMQDDTADMHRFYYAFGAGSRTCIGRHISWLEMSKLLVLLFMHYDIELADPEKEWTVRSVGPAVAQRGVEVRMSKRNP